MASVTTSERWGSPERRTTTPDTVFAIGVAILFACLCGFAMSYHEMWSDELQAWLIARDSSSLRGLREAMRHEGHTAIWYVLLYGVTRLTHRPEAMQLLHLGIATACAFVFARSAPFPRWVRLALCLGYFPVYEYGVIARNYSIGILFLFSAAALLPRRRERPWLLGLLLALAAHTNAMALVVATAFAGTVFLESLVTRGGRVQIVSALKTCLVAVAGILAALVFFRPPPDSGFSDIGPAFLSTRSHVEHVLGHLAEAVIPITSGRGAWGSFAAVTGSRHVAPLIALVVLACLLPYLLRRKLALLMFVASSSALFVFFYAKFNGSLRHYGFFLISLVVALWYSEVAERDSAPPATATSASSNADRLFAAFAGATLLVQLAFALVAVRQDVLLRFSAGRATASLLVEHHLDELPIVGDPDTLMPPVLGYLPQRTFYYPRGDRFGSYIVFKPSLRGPDSTVEEVFGAARELASTHHSAVGVVLERRAAAAASAADVGDAEKIGCIDADIALLESYCVYRLPAPEVR